ncbi:MAG: alpha/beta fold hydrolase [Planctomycetota bacterium]
MRVEGMLVRYSDSAWLERGDKPVLLFLHGSPSDGGDLFAIGQELDDRFRVVVPDLPGFGISDREVPDHSIRAQARYVNEFLEQLEIERAHVVGFSLGGGVALELAALAPERVQSITLLSSIGAQEYELSGSYRLNHYVHAAQLAAVWSAHHLLPHFGALDDSPFSIAFARSFYDTDQRRLRPILARVDAPLLIVHGERDFLVPVAAARESHRLVPQSELVVIDGSHFLPWTHTHAVAEHVERFVADVEAGRALSRRGADPARSLAASVPFDPASIPPLEGVALLVVLALIVLATFVSEDLTCIATGLLVADGRLGFVPGTLACLTGLVLGDLGLFAAGRIFGRAAAARAPLKWFVSDARLERASAWFRARGLRVIFLSRFTPGLRLPTYFAAGVLRTGCVRFAFYFLLACALWTPLLVGFSAWAGTLALDPADIFERHGVWILLALAATLLVVERALVAALTHRGRRMWIGAWRRRLRFEFWPPYVFYVPVVFYLAWLALKHRSLTVATAANPGIPTGGFIGESKTDILAQLEASGAPVARSCALPLSLPDGERRARAHAFIEVHALAFPVVLKPDVGQRGSGVRIVRTSAELEARIERQAYDLVLQAYAPGDELGIFYVRHPSHARGRIFSITEKRMPVLTGDGRRTLEELIVDDERAVCAARTYFDANAERLAWVPKSGERVQLVELGTHCRGAIFLDGAHLATPELESAIDAIARRFEGFFFGRFDVRTTSLEEVRAGRGFTIVELNGLTSEATHIYDPRTTLREAYRVLCEQWRIAFEIGVHNRARGASVTPLAVLVRETWRYRRLARLHADPAASGPPRDPSIAPTAETCAHSSLP